MPSRNLPARSGTNNDDLNATFRRVERLTAIGQLIGIGEQLVKPSLLDDDGLFSWRVNRTQAHVLRHPSMRVVERTLRYPEFLGLLGLRGAANLTLAFGGDNRAVRTGALTFIASSNYLVAARSAVGRDGSDQMAVVNFLCSLLEKAPTDDAKLREAASVALAGHACLSYFISGITKIASPVWRSGEAMELVLRTRTYGDQTWYGFVRRHPGSARALAWSVMAAETLFPLVLIAPRRVAQTMLVGGAAFHVANARVMGLNRFLWSYTATYPAIARVSRSLSPRSGSPVKDLTGTLVRQLGRPGVRRRAAALTAAAAVAVGGAVWANLRNKKAKKRSAEPGRTVMVSGRRIHVQERLRGAGPTVVFENGLGLPSSVWQRIIDGLPDDTNYLAYDRPGTGWSAPGSTGSAQDYARTLRSLLDAAGARPPYVLVGHSVGGVLIQTYARRYPEEVLGLVLLDSSHHDQFERSSHQRGQLAWARQEALVEVLQVCLSVSEPAAPGRNFSSLPPDQGKRVARCLDDPRHWWSTYREIRHWTRSWAGDSARHRPNDGTRIAVVTAGESVRADVVHDELQRELAELAAPGRRWHRTVSGADHHDVLMHAEHSKHAVEAILWSLEPTRGLIDDRTGEHREHG